MLDLVVGFCPSKEGWGPLSPSRSADFTSCFEYGGLVSGLSALFIFVAVLRFRKLQGAPRLPSSLVANSTFWIKLWLAMFALFASVAELVVMVGLVPITSVYITSLALQSIAAAVAVRLHYKEQFTSKVASTPLLLFWFSTSVLALIRLRTIISLSLVTRDPPFIIEGILYMVASLVTMAMELQPKPHMLYELPDNDNDDDDEEKQQFYDKDYR
ncbi:ATP-binding cassette glutathione S-conjugate transporter ycf1 [Coemansia sp. RSA 2559]|nr:ATP-binding cassette glutathione S-conjugate transporter ycf1 [Coemansia sp. RSA 2559]KAJ2852871.1 ATP-binding cassette glutathione S-conjugate transporter ycf1 [Coemansia erecta]